MTWSRGVGVEEFVVPSMSKCSESIALQTLAHMNEMTTTVGEKTKKNETTQN